MNINLHIERLILDGLPLEQRDGAQVWDAIAAELTQALTSGGVANNLAHGGALAWLALNAVQVDAPRPKTIGEQIARSIYGGIGAPAKRSEQSEKR